MGLKLSNKNTSLELTYSGFGQFCTTVAYIIDKKCGNEYEKYLNDHAYDAQILKDYINRPEYPFLNTLLFGDIEGKFSAKECKQIYDLIKNESTYSNFGYVFYPVYWENIVDLFKECAEHHWICRYGG